MSSPSSLAPALDGVDRALMISAPAMDMVETQCTFIDGCKATGVRHVIKFSGLDARHDSRFPFARMHKESEDYLETSGLAWTHLRPTGFMQVYLREAPSIINHGAFYSALGDARLNPIDLIDVARVVAEVADRISRAIGRTVRYVPVSREQRREALMAHGIPSEMADALDAQVEERLKGGLESQVELSTHQLFNVRPTTFLEFAQRNAEAFGRAAAAA